MITFFGLLGLSVWGGWVFVCLVMHYVFLILIMRIGLHECMWEMVEC